MDRFKSKDAQEYLTAIVPRYTRMLGDELWEQIQEEMERLIRITEREAYSNTKEQVEAATHQQRCAFVAVISQEHSYIKAQYINNQVKKLLGEENQNYEQPL